MNSSSFQFPFRLNLRRQSIFILLLLAIMTPIASADQIAPELSGKALRNYLREHYTPKMSLTYKSARHQMFAKIDNHDGKIRLVYTGVLFATRDIPDHRVVNTEHTWPQSKFGKGSDRSKMKTDLHHLFPTYNRVNGARGNSAFAEIPDDQTRKWWHNATAQKRIPKEDINEYSESTPHAFEPREAHKGNVARAMFYFYVIYEERGIDAGWFRPQVETFRTWNRLDPVDDAERERSHNIARVQGNENPFVLDQTLMDRVLQKEKEPEKKSEKESAPAPEQKEHAQQRK